MNILKRPFAAATSALAGFVFAASAHAEPLTSVFSTVSGDHQVTGTVTVLGIGLAGFVMLRKRRSSFQAMRAEQKTVHDRAP